MEPAKQQQQQQLIECYTASVAWANDHVAVPVTSVFYATDFSCSRYAALVKNGRSKGF